MAHLNNYCQHQAPVAERRNSIRYELEIPVVFSWEDAAGCTFDGEGVTRDISEVGVYVFTGNCPPPKSNIRIEVMLHAQPGIASAWLKGKMQVLRVEDGSNKFGGRGFALVGKTFSVSSAAQG